MKLRILLVNPWIYDFAAYNLWARPLGLLKVAEYLSAFDTELGLIDCAGSFENKKHGSGKFRAEVVEKPALLKNVPRLYKRYGIGIDEFVGRVKASRPFDIVFLTSIMSYWYPGLQKAIEIIRDVLGDLPVVLGGLYPTLCHDHACGNSGADFINKGPLNDGLKFALSTFGFRLKKKREALPHYRLALYTSHPFAPILTAKGCPFRCSYCASALLNERYERRSPDEVAKEIGDLLDLGVKDYVFYDDALLVDSDGHIKPLLRRFTESSLALRFHAPNGLHARYIDEELAGLMKKTGFETIRLGLETVDWKRQRATGGKVISEEMERAVANLKECGFTKKEIGVYLMYGLPGQPLKEVREGIGFLKSLGVRIHLSEFSPIKGTESWNEMVRTGVIDDDLDPLLTNNTVFSYLYSGYDWEEVERIKLDVKKYNNNPPSSPLNLRGE